MTMMTMMLMTMVSMMEILASKTISKLKTQLFFLLLVLFSINQVPRYIHTTYTYPSFYHHLLYNIRTSTTGRYYFFVVGDAAHHHRQNNSQQNNKKISIYSYSFYYPRQIQRRKGKEPISSILKVNGVTQ